MISYQVAAKVRLLFFSYQVTVAMQTGLKDKFKRFYKILRLLFQMFIVVSPNDN
jgi:hypothetical protein